MPVSDLARRLVRPAGTGDEGDADLVRLELDKLPPAELTMLRDRHVEVLACRGSIVDHRPDLANQAPRGWPAGYTWASAPGAYLPDENKVAIATLPDPATGARRIPPKGVMHSAWNLVIHETMHADDYLGQRLRSHNLAFLTARAADLGALDPYEQQAGAAGYEETYAESAARHFGADPAFAATWPHLAAFWTAHPAPIKPGAAGLGMAGAAPAHVGTAELGPDGAILLDLRAQSDVGAIGHALLTLAPGAPAYAKARAAIARAHSAGLGFGAAGGAGPVLIAPF